ncbi:hypothetical protein ACLB1M_20190 [Escherichia coli]
MNTCWQLDEMFSPGQEVLDAWGKAYGVLANVFINREAEIYNENASKAGGWEGTGDFRIVANTAQRAYHQLRTGAGRRWRSGRIPSGQYLGVWLKPEGFPHQEIRQYSLTRKPDGKGYLYCGETRRGWAGIQLVAQSRQCWRCRETGRSGRPFLYGCRR